MRVQAEPSIWVKVQVPAGANDETFEARLKIFTDRRMETFDLKLAEGEKAWLRAAFCDAAGLEDEQGNAMPWDASIRDHLIDLPHIRAAIVRAYFKAVYLAREGN